MSIVIRGSWRTRRVMVGPTSSGSGTPGVYVSRANADGTFGAVTRVVDNFGYNAGGWRVDRHPRFMADTTGDGRADIVGFGNAGVYVSRANADGTFGPVTSVVDNFGYNAGGWRVAQHPRMLGTRPVMVVPTSSGSGTPGCTCRVRMPMARSGGDECGRQLRVQRRWLACRSTPTHVG